MIICRISHIANIYQGKLVADKHWRTKLDRLREEMSISPRRLNEIAEQVLRRDIVDVRFLSETEVKKVMRHLIRHFDEISRECRRTRWQ